MPNWCDCTLTITGPNRQAVLDKIKGGLNDDGDQVYLAVKNIAGAGYGCCEFCDCSISPYQSLKRKADVDMITFCVPYMDSITIHAIHALSRMFPQNTFVLRNQDRNASSRSVGASMFRNGKGSHYISIPNFNNNTGKTATLFEIFQAVFGRSNSVNEALAEVARVEFERTIEVETETSNGDYDPSLDAEVKAILAPQLYNNSMIAADKAQIEEWIKLLITLDEKQIEAWGQARDIDERLEQHRLWHQEKRTPQTKITIGGKEV